MTDGSKKKERSRRLSRAEAGKVVAEYEARGLSREAFCAERGMGLTTLGRYIQWGKEARGAGKTKFVAVQVTQKQRPSLAGEAKLTVALANGRRIEVGSSFDSPMLEQLVRLLERA
jgi:hypothetical protein